MIVQLEQESVDEIKKTLADIQTHYAQAGRLLLEREDLISRLEQIDSNIHILKQTIPILEERANHLRGEIVNEHGSGTLDLDTSTYRTEDEVE